MLEKSVMIRKSLRNVIAHYCTEKVRGLAHHPFFIHYAKRKIGI
ncbi:hypothetical protein UYSO10_4282 [Kosakonia radicincitans]|nr:hypothetical protein UYSO10_4282 [Kosakonia radicincitans]